VPEGASDPKTDAVDALPPASRRWGDLPPHSDEPKWGMAVDLERCIGCWSCAVICKSENNVPLGMWWNRILTKGGAIDRPAEDHNGRLSMEWVPLACQHCEDPPCQKVCPTSATFTTKDGVVLVNAEDCIGCRYCMAACPYGVRVFNWGEPERSPGFDHGMVESRPTGTVEKCTFCVQRLVEGQVPSCVWSCPAQARVFGDLNDPDGRLVELIGDRGGEQLLEDKGTHPKVFYLQPRRRRSL
jgi:dimethyl sulfoxide reductase iron-sulfur subunit